MTPPLVSVLMNCRNAEDYLVEALDSVYAQTFTDWEIILYDNDSTDSTAEIARRYATGLRYHKSDEALRLGAARERALRVASGTYVAFLDSDDVWLPEKLERQVEAFRSPSPGQRAIGLCYTGAARIDAGGRRLSSYADGRAGLPQGDAYEDLMQDCFIPLSSVMAPRVVMREMGGFDQRLEFVEEWDLWLRIARRYDVILVEDELTKIRFHTSNVSRDFQRQSVEVLDLLERVSVATERERRLRDRAIDWWKLRYAILAAARARHYGVGRFLQSVVELVRMAARRPHMAFTMALRYLNPRLLRLIRYKFCL